MDVHILGTGAANDPTVPNSSVVVRCGGMRIMIDCGFSAAHAALAAYRDPDAIDALVFTHHHPDHSFGFVPLMVGWADAGRRKPLTVATTPWGRWQLETMRDLGVGPRWAPGFEFAWHEVPVPLTLGAVRLSFADTVHTVPNHAVRIDSAVGAFAYSGDGRPTPRTRRLFDGVDLLMHECHTVDPDPGEEGHCWLGLCAELQGSLRIGRTMLYHVRKDQRDALRCAVVGHAGVSLAETGSVVCVAGGETAE